MRPTIILRIGNKEVLLDYTRTMSCNDIERVKYFILRDRTKLVKTSKFKILCCDSKGDCVRIFRIIL